MSHNIIRLNTFSRSGKARMLRVFYQIGAWTAPDDVCLLQRGEAIEIQNSKFRILVCPLDGVMIDGCVVSAREWVDRQIKDHPH